MLCHPEKCCCCCCRMHVLTGSLVLAILGVFLYTFVGILLLVATTLISLKEEEKGFSIVFGIYLLIVAFVYFLVILAQQKRNHRYYLPALIFMVVSLVLDAIPIMVTVYRMIAGTNWAADSSRQRISGLIFHTLLSIWFLSIHHRAYKFLKNESTRRNEQNYQARF